MANSIILTIFIKWESFILLIKVMGKETESVKHVIMAVITLIFCVLQDYCEKLTVEWCVTCMGSNL